MAKLIWNLAGFAFLLASTTLTAEPNSPAMSSPPQPAESPALWVKLNDMPHDLVLSGGVAVVRFTLAIDRAGRVTNCAVTNSSGIEALDRQTCSLMTQRAKFKPATNAAGRPVSGDWSSSIRWQQPTIDRREWPYPTTN
jgi:periplasmic protein TonB